MSDTERTGLGIYVVGVLAAVGLASLAIAAYAPQKKRADQERRYEQSMANLNAATLELEARAATLYPFGADLNLDALSEADRMRLCGDDYQRIAIGWSAQKAVACNGPMKLVSESAVGSVAVHMYQRCDAAGCLNIIAANGIVRSWARA